MVGKQIGWSDNDTFCSLRKKNKNGLPKTALSLCLFPSFVSIRKFTNLRSPFAFARSKGKKYKQRRRHPKPRFDTQGFLNGPCQGGLLASQGNGRLDLNRLTPRRGIQKPLNATTPPSTCRKAEAQPYLENPAAPQEFVGSFSKGDLLCKYNILHNKPLLVALVIVNLREIR